MRDIVIVTERFHPFKGGTETRWENIASLLVERGHSVHIITGRGDITKNNPNASKYKKFEVYKGIKIHRVMDYRPAKLMNGTRSIKNSVNFGLIAGRYIQKYFKDAVIDINSFPHLHLLPLLIFCPRPQFITWYEVWNNEWRKYKGFGKFGKEIELINSKFGKKIISISHFTTRKLKEIGVNKKRIETIQASIPDNKITNKEVIIKQKARILFIGRMSKNKHPVDLAIPAFLEFAKNIPEAELHLCGHGSLSKKVETLANKYNNIFYHGFVTDKEINEQLEACSQLILPSSREGFGLVVLEANAKGKPVVVANFQQSAAAQEVVDHKFNGYIANPDPISLAEGLLYNETNLEIMIKNSITHVQKFRLSKMIDKIEENYIS